MTILRPLFRLIRWINLRQHYIFLPLKVATPQRRTQRYG